MIKNIGIITAILFFFQLNTQAQSNERIDSTSLGNFLKKGKFETHIRTYFLATDNAHGLTDYYAQAASAGISYESPKFHGLQVGLSGYFVFHLFSSDFSKPDQITGAFSRYEIGNFDITNPNNTRNLSRLENLYLRYSFSKSMATIGRQNLKTPFINGQDGRMRPSLEEGLYVEINEIKKIKIKSAWLWAMLPRSTVDWRSVAKGIGAYSTGRTIDGKPSNYFNHLSSKGIAITAVEYNINENFKMQVWDYYLDNIFNLGFAQIDYKLLLNADNKKILIIGAQGGLQQAINEGGNADSSKTYIEKNSHTYFIGGRLGYKYKKTETSLNYLYISDKSRLLFPREYGVEPFYTFLQRERNEGAGNVKAIVLKNEINWNSRLKTTIGLGYYDMPDVNNVRLNKYAMPAFYQINASINYKLTGFWQGLDLTALYVYKGRIGEIYGNRRNEINKINMSNINFIANYYF